MNRQPRKWFRSQSKEERPKFVNQKQRVMASEYVRVAHLSEVIWTAATAFSYDANQLSGSFLPVTK